MKTLRHPLIIKYLNGFESPAEIMIATERIRPLALQLDTLRKTPESILWIVYSLIVELFQHCSYLIDVESLEVPK